jgi:hypothetical protein
MISIQAIYISGFFIFLVASIIFLLIYLWKIWKKEEWIGKKIDKNYKSYGRGIMFNAIPSEKEEKSTRGSISFNVFMERWNRFRWIYFTMFAITFLLTLLYASLWTGQGLSIKPNSLIIIWSRWVIYLLISILVTIAYSFFVAKIRYTTQSFFIIFFGFMTILFLLFATLSQKIEPTVLWMIATLVSAFLTTFLSISPRNTLLSRTSSPSSSTSEQSIRKRKNKKFSRKRILFFLLIIIGFWLNFIIWLLAASNEVTSVILFDGENLAYLLIDIILVLIVLLALLVMMYRRTYAFRSITTTTTSKINALPKRTDKKSGDGGSIKNPEQRSNALF